jgi:hypothetical protein
MWWNRPDGMLVRDVPPTRAIMPYLMKRRNESAVYFTQEVDLTAVAPALADFRERYDQHVTVFHVVLAALARTLHERPGINRFVAGGRIYQRRGVQMSWAAKQRLDDGAPLVVVKREFPMDEKFLDLVRDIDGRDDHARVDGDAATDRELRAILALPGVARRAVLAGVQTADSFGMLPRWFIEGDPMYASAFLANLGSIHLDAPFHHLYEYGTIGLFCAIGPAEEVPVLAADGRTGLQPRVTLRLTYDERLADGFYAHRSLERFQQLLEDPDELGITA